MKEMGENPKLVRGLEEKMSTEKICVSDHLNGLEYKSDNKSDSFVLDMENLPFSHAYNTTKDVTANSRFTRSLSRKGSQRVNEDKPITNNNNNSSEKNERDSIMATSSPKAAIGGACMPEKPALVSLGMADHCSSPRVHHQITVTTANINAATDGRCTIRRNSFRRASPSWILDPKRILFLFATLSSLGTILLIYFTLSISRPSSDGIAFDLQQRI